jgi:hypothetical protein
MASIPMVHSLAHFEQITNAVVPSIRGDASRLANDFVISRYALGDYVPVCD